MLDTKQQIDNFLEEIDILPLSQQIAAMILLLQKLAYELSEDHCADCIAMAMPREWMEEAKQKNGREWRQQEREALSAMGQK